MDAPLIVLGLLQVVALLIYFWVGRVFISQPTTNHPRIFYDQTARLILCNGPAVTMSVLVVLAFIYTNSPWLFLGFSVAGWIACSPRPRRNPTGTRRPTFYDVIELPHDASQDLIKEQCIRLGERYRPDKNPTDPRAAYCFAQVEKAYETLGDPEKRASYDAKLRSELIDQDHGSFVEGASAWADGSSGMTVAGDSDGISLHSKINSWIALLFLLVVVKALSNVLTRVAGVALQANHFDAASAAIIAGTTGVIAAVATAVMFGRLLAWFMPLRPPLSGALMTHGTAEITFGKRFVATVALLVLVLVALMAGGLSVERLQREDTARIAAEDASRVAEETRRVAEETAKSAAEERARIAEEQMLAQQVRTAEARARIAEAQARAAEDQAAASNDARARADAQELARIETLRRQCQDARSANANSSPGSLASFYGASISIKVCSAYDQALRQRQYYQPSSRQRPVVDCNPRVQRCD